MSLPIDRLANQLDWNLLRTFMVIVQERSITGAAQRLNISQPAISAALRRLEERLEVRLIDRGSGQSFSVTPAGETVYREALEIYGGVMRLNDLTSPSERSISGNLIIYRSYHLDTGFLKPLLTQFHRQHPNVTFMIRTANCNDVNQSLLQRVSSVGFCSFVDLSARLRAYPLEPLSFGYFCGPAHPLFGESNPDAEALSRSDVVGFEEDSVAGVLSAVTVYRIREKLGDQVIAKTQGILDLLDLIRHSDALGGVPVSLAKIYAPDLWQIPTREELPEVNQYCVIDAERHYSPAERIFLGFLESKGLIETPQLRSEV